MNTFAKLSAMRQLVVATTYSMKRTKDMMGIEVAKTKTSMEPNASIGTKH